MGMGVLVIAVVLAFAALVGSVKLPPALRGIGVILAIAIFIIGILGASTAYVGPNEVGVVNKNILGSSLKDGKIIATDGEMGVQADVLPPGWHFGYWPGVFSVRTEPLIEIKQDQVGLIETSDGLPMPVGQLFAPEFTQAEFQTMLDAKTFLTSGKGFKGKQTAVLTPGTYRLNTKLFKVRMVDQTEVLAGEVAVLKSNFGTAPTMRVRMVGPTMVEVKDGENVPEDQVVRLARPGEMGILAEPLPPGKYALNTDAFTVTELWTTEMPAHYTAEHSGNLQVNSNTQADKAVQRVVQTSDDREITVITSDGFQFPVDVSVTYMVPAKNAPMVVARLGDDEGERFRNSLNSAVRSVFRNNAEKVKALDYVNMRSQQEHQSLTMMVEEMTKYGIKIASVRIRAVGGQGSALTALLKTQQDREIAKQELVTTIEQQKAAEQKKALTRTTQEGEEEKKLATAAYSVKIANEEQKRKLVEAEAEAQSIKIKATAQAAAYEEIAKQIGKSNAAMIEILKIVGERNIQIAPRVMVTGESRSNDGTSTALIGTMLDRMISDDKETKPAPAAPAK
jgi:regulator of protease activity HflC (stomatin/prohibitin superfamily)